MERNKETLDEKCIRYYKRFGSTIKEKPEYFNGLFIESFLFEGSLEYFMEVEDYDMCKVIKDFKEQNKDKIIEVSKEEYFSRLK